jgi:hypothetical protein
MRLSMDQVKQGLCHDNLNVRERCLRYFAGMLSDDTSIMRVVTSIIDERGKGAFEFFHDIKNLAQDDVTIQWVIGNLREFPDFFHDRNIIDFRPGILANGKGDLLQRHADDVMSVIPDWCRDSVSGRLALLSESPADLWDRLWNLCEEFAPEEKWATFPRHTARDLAVTMAERGCVPVDRVMELLTTDSLERHGTVMTWLEPYLIQMAGLIRYEPVLPILIEKLRVDADYLSEASTNALIRLGTDTVVRTVADHFLDEEWHWQMYSSAVFETIHSEESIRAATELLQVESIDEVIRQNIAHGLANQFSTEGLDALDTYLESHTDWLDNPEWTVTIPLMQASATLLGIDPSRYDHWNEKIEQACESGRARLIRNAMYDDVDCDDEDIDDDDLRPIPVTTFIRDEPRVGRNDPCPCGSGKKFKKCCLGKKADGRTR